jgi:hypothetical protein
MKKNIAFLLAFIFVGHFIWGQNTIKSVITNGNLNALNNVIERSELWDLSQSELRILRNTIFAKYGYIFRSVDLQNHFSRFSWYQATHTNVDNRLSQIDNENIARIQERENSLAEIVSYQKLMLSWVENEKITLPSDSETVSRNGMVLYQNPVLYPEMPDSLSYSMSDYTQAFCYAVGRFLTPAESEKIIELINDNYFSNAIIFNPLVLFLNSPMFGRVYRPFNDAGAFLLVMPRDNSAVYNVQANQILGNSALNILIMPWSVNYTLYKISNNGQLVLVDTVAAN